VDCRVGILDRSLDQGRLVDYFLHLFSCQPNSKEKKKKNILYLLTEEKTRHMNEYINNCVFCFFVTYRTEFINFTLNSTSSSKTTPPLETFFDFLFFPRACFPPNVYKTNRRYFLSLYLNNNNNRRQNSNTTICGWVPKQMFSYNNNNPIVYYVFIFFLISKNYFLVFLDFFFFAIDPKRKKRNKIVIIL
jgi:hypothetical protein